MTCKDCLYYCRCPDRSRLITCNQFVRVKNINDAEKQKGRKMTRIEKLRNMTTQEVAKLVYDIQSLELDGFCKSDCGDDDCLNAIPCIVKWLEEDIIND